MKEAFVKASEVIPPITHPLGRSWDQPKLDDILISDQHAMLSKKTFDALHEYSTTVPTGVYEGKMWKSERVELIYGRIKHTGQWFLRWYGTSDKPDRCSINAREIVL